MELKEIVAISGKSGLFRVIKPTKRGLILESIDENKSKLIAGVSHRVSTLNEISMYTTDDKGTILLGDILKKVFKKFGANFDFDTNTSKEDLFILLKQVLPQYDERKVYASDIRKLFIWYNIIYQYYPEILEYSEPDEDKKAKEGNETT